MHNLIKQYYEEVEEKEQINKKEVRQEVKEKREVLDHKNRKKFIKRELRD